MNTSSTNSTSTSSNLTVLILFSVNLAQQMCLQWPLSLLNIWLQFHTSLIHPNLKCVLLAQSASFCLFAYGRVANVLIVYFLGVDHWLDGLFAIQLPVMFSIQFMNAIGHILLLERLLATLLSKTYENVKSVYFTAFWATIIFLYCGYTAWGQVLENEQNGHLQISMEIVISAYIFASFALIEFILILIIGGHNAKKFSSQLRIQGRHNLSERFQIKDNIRTARQLGPTFFLHFVNIMISCEFPIVLYYGLITEQNAIKLFSLITQLAIAFGNILIEFTIISRHPILRQNAIQLSFKILSKFCPKSRRIESMDSYKNSNSTAEMQKRTNQSEEYFRILTKEWR